MSVSLVGHTNFQAAASGSYTIQGTSNLLIVFFYDTTSGPSSMSISDTKANSWNPTGLVVNATANNSEMFWCITNGTGSTTITCNDSSGTPVNPAIIVMEYNNTGGWPAAPMDSLNITAGSNFTATN